MQLFDISIAIETKDSNFTIGDRVFFLNSRNVAGMIKRFHTVTGDSYTEVGLIRSEMAYIVSFSYRVLQIISSISGNWFPGDFYKMSEWKNLCLSRREHFGSSQNICKFNNFILLQQEDSDL